MLVGYSLSLPGRHDATTITFAQTVVTIPVECEGHHGHHHDRRTQISVNIPNASYAAAQNSSAWLSQTDFSLVMPDLCRDGTMTLEEGATFTAMVGKQ